MMIGNTHVISFFDRSLQIGDFFHTYLFVGPEGVGKAHVALQIACALESKHALPLREFMAQKDDCVCDSCSAIARGTHPDVFIFFNALTIGDVRMLKDRLVQTPLSSPFHVIIIKNIHQATTEATQALLLLLEEPNDSTIFFLTAQNCSSVLPTVLSRSTIIHFFLTPEKIVADFFPSGEGQKRAKSPYEELMPYWRGRPARFLRMNNNEAYMKKIAETKKTAEYFLHASLAERFSLAQRYASWERSEAISALEEWLIWWREKNAFQELRLLSDVLQSLKHIPINTQTSLEYLALAMKRAI